MYPLVNTGTAVYRYEPLLKDPVISGFGIGGPIYTKVPCIISDLVPAPYSQYVAVLIAVLGKNRGQQS